LDRAGLDAFTSGMDPEGLDGNDDKTAKLVVSYSADKTKRKA